MHASIESTKTTNNPAHPYVTLMFEHNFSCVCVVQRVRMFGGLLDLELINTAYFGTLDLGPERR